ncbi:MAG: DegT/DnrJ/EryC1/StrS family aminotransferase [Lachnospiraceae bacterium]|jgi:dTDP-4-amino-4,6-dideoxygalactose transaminase|nr:DegT/DnrJ/EryC1/StrS family aminotransferase [Lachnospiraceae bacterium]
MKISANRMDRTFYKYQEEIEAAALTVLRSGWYVLGQNVREFEECFAEYVGAKYCVGLASGLDALWIALRILGIGSGDEVIVSANTYIASVMGITINGATPVFVEPDEYFNIDADRIEAAITPQTKAILPVHLYGQAADMEAVMRIAEKHGLKVVEDCAQSHGARQNGKATGSFGDVGCFSFYPTKNLGAYGEAGCIVTDEAGLAEQFRVFRNYGSEQRYHNRVVGFNSRLDELQAAMLAVKLRYLDELNAEKQGLCTRYLAEIKNPQLALPAVRAGCETVWHQFVVRVAERQRFIDYLDSKGIGTIIHYPIPPHLSEAYQYLDLRRGSFPLAEQYADEVLSLPLYNGMTAKEQDYVIEAVNDYGNSL